MQGAYDAAKKAHRLAQAKGAHDALIQAVYRMQADALEIEAGAKRRLADEYDAAQERGEVSVKGQHGAHVPDENMKAARATAAELGLTRKQVHDARQVRNAERAEPGIVRRTLDQATERREGPTRAELQRSVLAAVKAAQRPERAPSRRNPIYKPDSARDRVLRFTGLCSALAELEDMEALLGWHEPGLEGAAERLRETARAAWRRLDHFVTFMNSENPDA